MNETDKINSETGLEIAVIGMAVRFPGAKNIDEFWDNLKNGIDSITFFSDHELRQAGVEEHVLNHPDYVKAMGFLPGVDEFDANFFDYTPIEVEAMDPQIRLFHECAWEALEDAAYEPDSYDGLIGLYAGASDSFYWKSLAVLSGKEERFGQFELEHLTNRDFLCSRVAYKLDLKGPVVYVQTACSTSLVAIHMACQGLLSGETDIALAGGVTVNPFKGGYVYQEGMILSPDGHCRAFDRSAKGIVGGNGGGIVVLKRFQEAIEEGDHIYAIIKGSAINNDGKQKMGYTAPSVEGQSEVIGDALQTAQVEKESIGYLEAHGTGTTLGDPVEIEALKLAFKTNKKGYCGIGSVKTNFGHLDNAAGVAGFIKTVLVLKHQLIPPSLHFETPNPRIDFINSPFYINAGLAQWEKGENPRRAGVSSLGIGGTNAHVILEEAPQPVIGGKRREPEYQLILLSAKTPSALEKITENLVEYLKKHPQANLSQVAYTLQVGRKAFKYRRMTICSTVDETIAALSSPGPENVHDFVLNEDDGNRVTRWDEKPSACGHGLEKLEKIGRLWLHGQKIDWKALEPGDKRYRVSLPTYPFERHRYWIEGDPFTLGARLFSKGSPTEKKADIAQWFYIPSWKRVGPVEPIETKNIPAGLCWLVLLDTCGLGSQLLKQLETAGEVVITVEPGPLFLKVNNRHFIVNPRQEKDYETLFHELVRLHKPPHRIVHLWGITPGSHEDNTVDADRVINARDSGFYSLINIAKAIGKQGINHEIRLTAITNHMQEVTGADGLYPEKAIMLGPIKVIPTEYTNIRCQGIDVELPLSGSSQEKKLVRQLQEELIPGTPDPVIAYRGGYRWVQVFEPQPFEASRQKRTLLRQKGVYLVTGGLGGIGLALAGYLAKSYQARLVLTGRTPFPARDHWDEWSNHPGKNDGLKEKIQKVKELEGLGAEVLVCTADAANRQQMDQVIARAEEQFGPINGIIHCAGLADGEMIQPRTPEASERIFTSKITGTLVLDSLLKTKGKALDFFVLCSSITAILPIMGQVGYCAANAFLDAFAHYRGTFDSPPYVTVSINWDRWQNVGIATIAETHHKELTGEDLAGGMTREQGIEVFNRILSNKVSQVVVSTQDLGTLLTQAYAFNAALFMEGVEDQPGPKTLRQRPELSTKYKAPSTQTQESLTQTWENFFGFQQLGIQDDFFELGGDSLKVLLLLPKIHKELGVNISIAEFFNNPNIEKLSACIDGADKSVYSSIKPVEKKEYYPLTSAQKRLYLLQQMDLNSTGYNIPLVLPIGKDIEKDKIESCLRKLIARHESLRTSFEMVDEEPVQRVHARAEFQLENYELPEKGTRGLAPLFKELAANTIKNFVRPFDLSRAPLMRSGIITTPDGNQTWMLDVHHIVSDGMSQAILTRDFISLYNGEELAGLRVQYKDFSGWQNRLFASEEIEAQEAYWLELYSHASELPRLNLPCDHHRPEIFTFAGDHYEFVIEKETAIKFREWGARNGSTLFMSLLAVLNILFYKYTGQTDIIIGTGTSGRPHNDLQPIIGMFVNTLAIRNYPREEKSFESFVKEVITHSVTAFENQEVQFEALVDKLDLERDPSRNPLFDISLVLLNFDYIGEKRETSETMPFVDENLLSTAYQNPTSRFDMTFFVHEPGEEIYINIEYYTGIFEKETIHRLVSHFKNIIQAVIDHPGIRLKDIGIITGEERQQVLYEFNDTVRDYPKDKTIHRLFAEQVEQNPDNIAVVAPLDTKYRTYMTYMTYISYRELN
ncbi:MAG: SDR family NAD(P)-dependent oxidoreductase, partial [Candidatus Aminicenantes bacterium]